MNKISGNSFNLLRVLNEHASKMPLGLAWNLMNDNEEKLTELQKLEFVALVFLKHMMKITEQGYVPKTELERLSTLPDEVLLAYEIAGRTHAGYACSIGSPGVEGRITEVLREYPLNGTGKELKDRIKNRNKSDND